MNAHLVDELLDTFWRMGVPVSHDLHFFTPVSENEAADLLKALELPAPGIAARKLQELVRKSVLHLASFYSVDLAERASEPALAHYSADPARALAGAPYSPGDRRFRDILRSWAWLHGEDPDSIAGAVLAGDLARGAMESPPAHRRTSFSLGEAVLFAEIFMIARALNPASLRKIPDKDAPAWPTPVPAILNFSTKYVDIVADRAEMALGVPTERVRRQLHWVRSNADHAKRLRQARRFLRRNESNGTVKG